jgi:hypothetical protein
MGELLSGVVVTGCDLLESQLGIRDEDNSRKRVREWKRGKIESKASVRGCRG